MVGLFMERSLEMVIGIYGIIKAGGAYVALDPEYPSDRIGFIIEETEVPVLLTQEKLVDSLPERRQKYFVLIPSGILSMVKAQRTRLAGRRQEIWLMELTHPVQRAGPRG